MDDIDHEMRFVNLLGKFGPLCGTRWGQAQLKLNLRDLLMQLSTLVSAVVALESAPASATLNRRCNGGGVFRPRYCPVVELPTLKCKV